MCTAWRTTPNVFQTWKIVHSVEPRAIRCVHLCTSEWLRLTEHTHTHHWLVHYYGPPDKKKKKKRAQKHPQKRQPQHAAVKTLDSHAPTPTYGLLCVLNSNNRYTGPTMPLLRSVLFWSWECMCIMFEVWMSEWRAKLNEFRAIFTLTYFHRETFLQHSHRFSWTRSVIQQDDDDGIFFSYFISYSEKSNCRSIWKL